MRILVLSLLLALSAPALAQRWEMAASELRGTPVATPEGAALGTIAGVLLDVRPRGVHFAILEVAGAPEGAAKRFAYPVNALRPAPGEALLLDVRPQNLRLAPGYQGRSWPDPQFRDGTRYVRAAKVLGSTVRDRLRNPVGRVAGVIVSLRSGTTERVLVDFDDAQTLSLPAHAVRLEPGGGAVVVAPSSRRT